jgi:hypothetical protein
VRAGVYGGIHFEFSNQAGLTAGAALGDYVLKTFSTTSDTTPPTILLSTPSSGLVSGTNTTITGQVLDNLSGVQSLQVQLDGGAFSRVSFDAAGKFSLSTQFALDGSADGTHVFNFQATDFAGNTTALLPVSFMLDTKAPAITLTSPAAGDLAAGAALSGTASGTGSAITALSYSFDGGTAMPVPLRFHLFRLDDLHIGRLPAFGP